MSSSSQVAESWIASYCSLLGHEYFAEVSEDFIEDDFNLTGLAAQVPMYKEALEMILDVEPEDDEDEDDEDLDEDELDEDDQLGDGARGYRRTERRHMRMASDLSVIEGSAELLYGLIHQRYITSRPGMQQMLEKYELQHFGHCPRVFCNGAKVLPVGCSDTPGQETVKLFCPSCLDIYTPPNSRFQTVDGAFFGTTFGCLFFMTFPELEVGQPRAAQDALMQLQSQANGSSSNVAAHGNGNTDASTSRTGSSSSQVLTPSSAKPILPPQPASINGVPTANLAPGIGHGNIYEPRIYGFRVSERARTGPRMQWLRMKPADITELDEARKYREEMGLDSDGNEEDDEADDEDAEQQEEHDAAMPDAPPPAKSGRRKLVPASAASRGKARKTNGSSPMEGVAGNLPPG